VAVHEGGKKAPVDIAWNGGMFRARLEACDRLLSIPLGANLQTMVVRTPASIAVGDIFRIVILEEGTGHGNSWGGRVFTSVGIEATSREGFGKGCTAPNSEYMIKKFP
jgi:hypothetical protein